MPENIILRPGSVLRPPKSEWHELLPNKIAQIPNYKIDSLPVRRGIAHKKIAIPVPAPRRRGWHLPSGKYVGRPSKRNVFALVNILRAPHAPDALYSNASRSACAPIILNFLPRTRFGRTRLDYRGLGSQSHFLVQPSIIVLLAVISIFPAVISIFCRSYCSRFAVNFLVLLSLIFLSFCRSFLFTSISFGNLFNFDIFHSRGAKTFSAPSESLPLRWWMGSCNFKASMIRIGRDAMKFFN